MRKTRIWAWQAARWLAVLLICCICLQNFAAGCYGGETEAAERANGQTAMVSENEADEAANTDEVIWDVKESHTAVEGVISEMDVVIPAVTKEETINDDMLEIEKGVTEYESTVSENEAEPVRILFVGNSFTKRMYDQTGLSIPMQLSEMAEQSGKNVHITTVIRGGTTLQVFAGSAGRILADYQRLKRVLQEQHWDYVVLQENSAVSAFAPDTEMLPSVSSLKTLIMRLQPDAKLLLYMTHGYEYVDENGTTYTTQKMQRLTAAGYHEVSVQTGIEVVPAGMQLMRARTRYPNLEWILSDDKHPTQQAYFVLAATFYTRLFREVPQIDASRLRYSNLTQEQVDTILALQQDYVTTDQKNLVLKLGEMETMRIFDRSGETVSDAVFYSTNPKVISVDKSSGEIKADAYGKAVVIAQAPDGCQACCLVCVPKPLQFSRDIYVIGVGDKLQIQPEGDSKDLFWKSSRLQVATVDQSGQILAVGAGKTHITVTNRKNRKDRAEFDLYVSCGTIKELSVSVAKVQPADGKHGALQLSWKKVQGADGYAIYRSKKPNGKYRRIATTKKRKYMDGRINTGQIYYYKVKPVYKKYKMCDGPLSAPVKGMVLTVRKLQGEQIGKKGYRLTWKQSKLSNGYEIYRADKKKGNYTKIADIKGTKRVSYTDWTKVTGKTVYYKVVPYRREYRMKYYGRESLVEIK